MRSDGFRLYIGRVEKEFENRIISPSMLNHETFLIMSVICNLHNTDNADVDGIVGNIRN